MDPGYDIGIYVLVSITVIGTALLINWSLTFYRLWRIVNLSCIGIRRPTAVLFSCIVSICALIRVVSQCFFSFDLVLFNKVYPIQSVLITFAIALFYSVVYRTFLIYYDIKFNQALETEQWQCHIDTNTIKTSWFIRHRQKYRNPKKVAFVLAIPLFFLGSIGTLSVIIKGRNPISLLTNALNMLIPVVLLIILICKMPRYDDHYKLRKESIIVSLVVICGMLAHFPILILLKAAPGNWQWILTTATQIGILWGVPATSTFWVFRQFRLPAIYCRLNAADFMNLSMSISTQSVNLAMSHSMSSVKADSSGDAQITTGDIEIHDVLKDDELFLLFARHLSKEFCIENLLYFVEMHQFARYLSDHCGITLKLQGIETYELTATNIPQSTIIQDLKDGGDLNDAAINLFHKYIDYQDAYFCINISSETRQSLYGLFGYLEINEKDNKAAKAEQMRGFMKAKNVTPVQIYDVFHETRGEIFQLLLSSFIRFKKCK